MQQHPSSDTQRPAAKPTNLVSLYTEAVTQASPPQLLPASALSKRTLLPHLRHYYSLGSSTTEQSTTSLDSISAYTTPVSNPISTLDWIL
jgi:hypothetical protein